jgi:hypothetical protein
MDKVPTHKFTHETQHSWLTKKIAGRFPIFGSHTKRIGLIRTSLGGFPMYLGIPVFCIWHLFCLYIFATLMLQPLLGLRKLRFKDYVIIDRHKIADLPWLDRLNCVYCGYANGLATFFEASLSQVEQWEGKLSFGKKIILFFGFVFIYTPFSLLTKLSSTITYDWMISYPLGLHRLSEKNAKLELESWGVEIYKNRGLTNYLIREERVFSIQVNNALEQVESSWCPIKHADVRSEVVYPKHHVNFIERDDIQKVDIQKVKDILQSDGTVSQKKPYR